MRILNKLHIVFLMLFSVVVQASSMTYSVTGKHQLSNEETIEKGKRYAYEDAIQQGFKKLPRYAELVEKLDQKDNYSRVLTQVGAAIFEVKSESYEHQIINNQLNITATLSILVDTSIAEKRINALLDNANLRKRIVDLEKQNNALKSALVSANEGLSTQTSNEHKALAISEAQRIIDIDRRQKTAMITLLDGTGLLTGVPDIGLLKERRDTIMEELLAAMVKATTVKKIEDTSYIYDIDYVYAFRYEINVNPKKLPNKLLSELKDIFGILVEKNNNKLCLRPANPRPHQNYIINHIDRLRLAMVVEFDEQLKGSMKLGNNEDDYAPTCYSLAVLNIKPYMSDSMTVEEAATISKIEAKITSVEEMLRIQKEDSDRRDAMPTDMDEVYGRLKRRAKRINDLYN